MAPSWPIFFIFFIFFFLRRFWRGRLPRKLKCLAAPQRQGLPRLTRVPNPDPDPDPDPDADADADDGFRLGFLIGLIEDFEIREVINRYVVRFRP